MNRNDQYGDEPFEARLRASLSAKAGHAPASDYLAEQIIATAERGPALASRPSQPGGWRTWTLPLIAAGAVAAVVGAVVSVAHVGHDTAGPATSLSPLPSFGTSLAPTPATSPTMHSQAAHSAKPAGSVGDLHGFRAYDATFYRSRYGWAIGTAECENGSGGSCAALVRMVDGRTWSEFHIHNLFPVGAGSGDVQHIRFATPDVGYAYGPDAFWTTTDGGVDWTKQSGGAYAVETFDNNVIRVESATPGCPPGCSFTVQTAGIDGVSWTRAVLPGGSVTGDHVQLVRTGSDAGLLVLRNPAGGASDETSALYTSTDDGATWTARGELCPQSGPSGAREVDSTGIAASGDGYSLVCTPRQQPAQSFVITSSGGQYQRAGEALPQGFATGQTTIAGAPSTVLAVGGFDRDNTSDGLEISVDGGKSWEAAADVTGQVSFIGFESGTLGRAITNGGRTIWTTRNGGTSWSEFTFPS